MSDEKGDAARGIRARVKRFGLRVVCLSCATRARHFPESGRVRDALCRRCGLRELRPEWWVARYPDRAREEVKRARILQAIFD